MASHPATSPKIAIVGQGAIGGLIGFKSHQLGYDYQHLLRTTHQHALQVTEISGHTHTLFPQNSNIKHPSSFDVLIVPVKAYQVLPVLEKLASFIRSEQVLMLLHNGMGTIEQVSKLFPDNPLLVATTSYGAYKPAEHQVTETGLGETHLGWIKQPDIDLKYELIPILSSLLPPTYWHTDITLALWKKLAINAVINPLTSIHRIRNGQLADNKFQSVILELCKEISCVLKAMHHVIEPIQLVENIMQVVKATHSNYSSMYQDIQNHRPTEIEFITGHIVSVARNFSIAVPTNEKLLAEVKSLDVTN